MFGQESSEHDIISIFQPLNGSSKSDNQTDETYKNQQEVWKDKFSKFNIKYCEVQREKERLEVENKSDSKAETKNEWEGVGKAAIKLFTRGQIRSLTTGKRVRTTNDIAARISLRKSV